MLAAKIDASLEAAQRELCLECIVIIGSSAFGPVALHRRRSDREICAAAADGAQATLSLAHQPVASGVRPAARAQSRG